MTAPAYIITDSNVTIILNNKPFVMANDHPNFNEVLGALVNGQFEDLESFFDMGKAVVSFADGNFEVADGQVFYKGEAINNHVVDRVLDFIKRGLPHKPLLNFLDKLMANPSRRAVNELYKFLEHKNMPITSNGNFQAYKSVKSNWTDHHTGKFMNTVGSVLEMKRNQVCDDANIGCGYGFHVGSLEYAKSFGGAGSRLLIVEVNPADVVSVPVECDCQKLRTTKYKVVAEYERPLNEPLVDGDYDSDDIYDESDPDDESYNEGYERGYQAAVNAAKNTSTSAKLRDKANRQPRNKSGQFA